MCLKRKIFRFYFYNFDSNSQRCKQSLHEHYINKQITLLELLAMNIVFGKIYIISPQE